MIFNKSTKPKALFLFEEVKYWTIYVSLDENGTGILQYYHWFPSHYVKFHKLPRANIENNIYKKGVLVLL